jgi:hypothetical protein
MAQAPNVAGMMTDPDFQALAPSDKRAALTAVTGDKSFDSLDDGETMQFVSGFPSTKGGNPLLAAQGLGNIDPSQQAQQQLATQDQQLMQGAAGANEKGATSAMRAARQGLTRKVVVSGASALPAVGTVVGSALGSEVPGAGNVAGAALGGAGGEAAKKGFLAMIGQNQQAPFSGQNLQDIGMAGAQGAGAEMGGQIIGKGLEAVSPAIGRGIQKLMGESPERIAELQSLFPKERALEGAVNQAEEGSRTAFKAAYDNMGIDAASVNVAKSRNLANNAAEELSKFTGVPRPLSKVTDIPRPSESMLVGNDPGTILDQLASWDQVPFRDAQRFREGLETYISKSRPPAQVYNALKQVSGALSDGLKATADTEGKLPEYLAANKMFKEHAADFWNKGAPLRDYLPIQKGGKVVPGQEGATLNRLTQTANQSRALDALQRRGVPTDTIKAILSQGTDAVKTNIADAVTLKNMGQGVLDQQARAPVRAAVLKRGMEAVGIGSGGILADYLARKVGARK